LQFEQAHQASSGLMPGFKFRQKITLPSSGPKAGSFSTGLAWGLFKKSVQHNVKQTMLKMITIRMNDLHHKLWL